MIYDFRNTVKQVVKIISSMKFFLQPLVLQYNMHIEFIISCINGTIVIPNFTILLNGDGKGRKIDYFLNFLMTNLFLHSCWNRCHVNARVGIKLGITNLCLHCHGDTCANANIQIVDSLETLVDDIGYDSDDDEMPNLDYRTFMEHISSNSDSESENGDGKNEKNVEKSDDIGSSQKSFLMSRKRKRMSISSK